MKPTPRILDEDDDIVAIDKPAGMPSVSLAAGKGLTLASWLLARYPEMAHLPRGENEAGLVHRLDNDTSGVILAARTTEAHHALREEFSRGRAVKRYLALVLGRPPAKGRIDLSIAHHPRKKRKMIACASAKEARAWKGRPAATTFSVKARYEHLERGHPPLPYALLEVVIKSGARHQVRVHLASIGHPISGDALYQSARLRAEDRLGSPRHLLHASQIEIRHPRTGHEARWSSPLPRDMRSLLAKVRKTK